MGNVEEFAQAVEKFLGLPEEEQRRILLEAEARAKEISDRFDRACRVDPMDLCRPMTI